MVVPSCIVQGRQSWRKGPHQQGRTHRSSSLLRVLQWCTIFWSIYAWWQWPWQLREGGTKSSAELTLPTATNVRTLSLGLFPSLIYNTKLLYWILFFYSNSTNLHIMVLLNRGQPSKWPGPNLIKKVKLQREATNPGSFKVTQNLVYQLKCVSLPLSISSENIFRNMQHYLARNKYRCLKDFLKHDVMPWVLTNLLLMEM